ncbi:hypothetical protein TruAng_006087 [Truncatella angustata]|nr:hypothetical protein TruAng_006087 [Truncatella angustata]
MNSDYPRRSACDRCRGQKLRCVRPPQSQRPSEGSLESLQACERCIKAGADCVHTVRSRRLFLESDGHGQRPSSGGSDSPTVVHRRRPTNDHHSSTASDQAFRHQSSQTPHFVPNVPQRRSISQIQNGGSSQSQVNSKPTSEEEFDFQDTFQHQQAFHTATSAAASSATFPAPILRERTPSSAHTISFELGGFHPGVLSFNSDLSHGTDSQVSLNHLLDDATGDRVGLTNSTSPSWATTSQMPGNKDECLYQLSELSSRLLKYFSKTGVSTGLPDILKVTPAEVDGTDRPERRISSKNMVGTLFESSQVFLEALERLKSALSSEFKSSFSSANSECSYSEQWDDSEFLRSIEYTGTQRTSQNGALLLENDVDPITTVQQPSEPQEDPSRQHASVGMPTTLTILTCYTWLLQGYEMVFGAIQDSLILQRKSQGQALPPPTPLVLPDLQFGGFGLDRHPDLQIEILIHVSCQMLQKIDATLGISSAMPEQLQPLSSDQGHDLLVKEWTPALLGRQALVRRRVDSIKQLLVDRS